MSRSKRKRHTDSKRLSDVQQKNRRGKKQQQGRLRKTAGEQRQHHGQGHEEEAEGEGDAQPHQRLLQVDMWAWEDRLEGVLIEGVRRVGARGVALDGVCVGEDEVWADKEDQPVNSARHSYRSNLNLYKTLPLDKHQAFSHTQVMI